jgi:long-chain acyl-CoA synthetase
VIGEWSETMSFNVAVILSETASASPGKAAAVYAGGQLTYGELDALSGRLAVALELTGVRPGDPLALQLPNIPLFLIAFSYT